MQNQKHGRPIAQRVLRGTSETGKREVLIRIFAPFQVLEELWRCPYDIGEAGSALIESDAAGADSVQALTLALYKIEVQHRHSGKLSNVIFEEEDDGGFGFLTPRGAWALHDREGR